MRYDPHTQKAHQYVQWKVCQPPEGWKELLIHGGGVYLYEISLFKFFSLKFSIYRETLAA